MSGIAEGERTNPYTIASISLDHVLALPGKRGAYDSSDPSQTIKVTIKVVWASGDQEGQPANADVVVSPNEPLGFFALFDDHHLPKEPYSGNLYSFPGNADGIIEVYVCCPQIMLFNILIAVAEGTNYDQSEWSPSGFLTFYNYITFDVYSPTYPPIGIYDVQIPEFPSLKFGMTAYLQDPDYDLTIFTNCVVIINDNLIFLQGGPDILKSGFVIPYIFMNNSFDSNNNNTIIYILSDNSGSTSAGGAITFNATGYPLAMPFPRKGDTQPAPQLATTGGYVLDTLYLNANHGIPLLIPIKGKVTEDDKYYIYIYVNGFVYDQQKEYKKYAVICRPVPVPVGYTDPVFQYTVQKADVIGYAQASDQTYGYMWADCIGPDNETWTAPWGPQQINFWPDN